MKNDKMKGRGRKVLAAMALPLSIMLAAAVGRGAWEFIQRGKQVRTFTSLKSVTKILERQREMEGRIDIEAVVTSVNAGLDAWGNEIAFATLGSRGYLLVSPGSDGVFEHADLQEYQDLGIQDIRGRFSEDIVFISGSPVTIAGK